MLGPNHLGRLRCADFTIYSAPAQSYVSVRLVIEIGIDHGVLIPSKHVRLLALRGMSTQHFPSFALILELSFSTFVFLMILLEINELLNFCRQAEVSLQES